MSPIQATALGVRLFVIWAALYFGRAVPGYYLQIRGADDASDALIVAIGVVIFALLAFLWLFPRTVARTLLPPGDALSLGEMPEDRWLAVGCALLGLWILAEALPGIVQQLYVLYYAARAQFSPPGAGIASLVYCGIEALIGAWLLLGAAGLRKLWQWMRDRPSAE